MAIEVGDWVWHAGTPMKVEQVLGVMLMARTLEGRCMNVLVRDCEPWAPEAGAPPEPPKPDLVELLEAYEDAQQEHDRAEREWRETGEAMSVARAALVAAMEGRP